jgi:adenosylmethionine-8-amino-7-oxononanoate aminotransferase
MHTTDPTATHVLHRQLATALPVAVRAQGVQIFDAEGRAYIDASGGAAVSCLGHGHPDVLAAMHAQIDRLAYAHTSFFTTEVAEALADDLVAHAPAGISHAYLVSGGSEAVEAALKMAPAALRRGRPAATHALHRAAPVLPRQHAGRAGGGRQRMAAAPVCAAADRRDTRLALLRIPRPPSETRRQSSTASAWWPNWPTPFTAWVAKTSSPSSPKPWSAPPPACCCRCRATCAACATLCTRHGILLILDEVMCGMGRTGTLHACAAEGVVPDLMTIAKGLGGGYQPIGAVLVQRAIVDSFSRGSGLFQHGHTYIGHAVACAAALAVQRVIRRDGLLAAVQQRGASLQRRLLHAFAQHPHVGDIRGRGLFWGLELVATARARRRSTRR